MGDKALPMRMVRQVASDIPASFNGDQSLFLWNLFLMTAMFFIAAMLTGRQATRIWQQRRIDHPLDPVTLYRLLTLFAAGSAMLRCGAEALLLWGWSPADPATTARVIMAKRWLDPIAVGGGFIWMSIVMLGEPGIEFQLRKAPLPVDMWPQWPVLMRALGVIILAFIAASAAVLLR